MVLVVKQTNADRGFGGLDDLMQCAIVERLSRRRRNESRSIARLDN